MILPQNDLPHNELPHNAGPQQPVPTQPANTAPTLVQALPFVSAPKRPATAHPRSPGAEAHLW